MIKRIKIANFKSIEKIDIKFNNLNLLCGENASGKTTVIHALLIVTQKQHNNRNFDGDVVKIGSLSELKNFNKGSEIAIEANDGINKKTIVLKRNPNLQDNNQDILLIDPADCDFLTFDKQVFYLSSNRMGALDTYSKGNNSFGINGESTVSFLSEHQDCEMTDNYMKKIQDSLGNTRVQNNKKYIEHVRFWLEYITGEKISINTIPYTNQYVLTFGGESNVRPINTGTGYSYVLPIVIACLGATIIDKNASVIIENPEIYLHPEAQFKLSEFLLFISDFVQLIVETHSEHVLKRVMEKKKKNHQVLLFEKKDKKTIVDVINSANFKTHPIAYPEVLYKVFHIPTIELHILLFGMLKLRCDSALNKNTTILDFDQWLITQYPNIPKKERERANGTKYETLITYIRNTIDHPEEKDNNGSFFYYSDDDLQMSLDFMLSVL